LAGYIVTTGDRQEIERAFDMGEKDIVILVVGQEALRFIEEEIAKRNG
jgi:hypothetical protein